MHSIFHSSVFYVCARSVGIVRTCLFLCLFVVGIALAISLPAFAEKRAFLVSIDKYTAGISNLNTATNDVTGISKALRDIGFEAAIVKDPDRAEFDRRWLDFRSSLKENDVAVFYFGGHGIQLSGANYLLPGDTPLSNSVEAVLEKAINFHGVMEELEARKLGATIYVLDACRHNPFSLFGSGAASPLLGQTKGLARMESVFGAFVMYSAGTDEEAIDALPDKPQNSIFANRLIPLIGQPQLSLVDMAKRVQVEVEADARRFGFKQRPAYFDGIIGQFYLAELDRTALSSSKEQVAGGANVIRLGGFATWDNNCRARPAPQVRVSSAPNLGRILTRFENVTVGGTHFGKPCQKSVMRGIGVYYVISDEGARSRRLDRVNLSVNHWSISPATSVSEVFEIDLATRQSKRQSRPTQLGR